MTRSIDNVRRRLAAVWFADLVGYSALSSTDEDRALGVVRRFQAAAREAAEAHQGRIVKFLGDGALAEFASAADAVDAARDLAAFGDDPSAGVRIGIHIGEIATIDEGVDVYGDGVNVASRIQALAEPGQILVSEDVRRHLRQRPAYRFQSLGERSLKGIAAPLALFALATGAGEEDEHASRLVPETKSPRFIDRVRARPRRALVAATTLLLVALAAVWLTLGPGDSSTSAGAGNSDPGPGSGSGEVERSIAVLPLDNLSPDPENAYFADGMTEEITLALSKVPDLRVVSRTSASQYAGSDRSIREIARELGVATVLEGSVRRAGNRVRITAQLIEARTDEHLWAETYDRELADVFEVQSEIAQRIAEELQASFTNAERERILAGATRDPVAHDLYLQALRLIGSFDAGRDEVEPAIELLRQAVRRDPSFARAWEHLAILHVWSTSWSGPTASDSSRAALDRALALEPDSPRALYLESVRAWFHEKDRRRAIEVGRQAAELAPSDPQTIGALAEYYLWNGDLPEAIHWAERLVALDPRNPAAHHHLIDVCLVLELDDCTETAIQRLIRIAPSLADGWIVLSELRLRQGRYAEAIAAADSAVLRNPDEAHIAKGLALLWSGNADAAIPELEAFVRTAAPERGQLAKPVLAHAYRKGGEADRVGEILVGVTEGLEFALREVSWNPPLLQYTLLEATAAAGDRDRALAELEEYVAKGGRDARLLAVDPVLESIRGDPRFQATLEDLRQRVTRMRAVALDQR